MHINHPNYHRIGPEEGSYFPNALQTVEYITENEHYKVEMSISDDFYDNQVYLIRDVTQEHSEIIDPDLFEEIECEVMHNEINPIIFLN